MSNMTNADSGEYEGRTTATERLEVCTCEFVDHRSRTVPAARGVTEDGRLVEYARTCPRHSKIEAYCEICDKDLGNPNLEFEGFHGSVRDYEGNVKRVCDECWSMTSPHMRIESFRVV